ncbi:SIR2 family protein [Magnetovibrio sp. PR-2]|uniref:TPR end-of-group domain-containing protein n=1 Tax=Magnetovibrio sp. PR-2 TaxID=3120356 RepID=UPI002FCE3A7E
MDQCTLDHLIEDLADNHKNEYSTALLIGAGCSKSAGIPLAQGFIDEIKADYRKDYDRAKEKTYAHCMGALCPADRHALISKYIDNAEINPAHIAIAQLMKEEYVDRVLTTNFDPLVIRACSLAHFFPAVYDMAASPKFSGSMVRNKAVFHLHGQRNGFAHLHKDDQFKALEHYLKPLFSDTNTNRMWIVVGYSGGNDPVFRQLAELHDFDRKLYWVVREKEGPSKEVRDALSKDGKAAYWVHAEDADALFMKIADAMGCWPPEFAQKPFSHQKVVLSTVAQLSVPGMDSSHLDWLHDANAKIDQAIETLENDADDKGNERAYTVSQAHQDLALGQTESVLRQAPQTEEFADVLAWAYVIDGDALLGQARLKTGAAAEDRFVQAGEKYAAALAINPDKHEALNNWGVALSDQAQLQTGAAADELFVQAGVKFAAALAIKPDLHEALHNWGVALSDQARLQTGAAADELFVQAGVKFAAALAIKPDLHEALHNWGTALSDQAKLQTGAAADELFVQAGEKYAAALAIKPDKHEALSNWGSALADQAKLKTGAAADALFVQAGEKYAAALAIKPDLHEALNNWGLALSDQAQLQTGAAADALFVQAGEKYAAALAIKPDLHEALYNWGAALSDQAQLKTGAAADELFVQAGEKYAAALAIKPDKHEALNNWGNALTNQAKLQTGAAADELFVQAGEKYAAALAIKPDLHEALYNWGNALSGQARLQTGAAADALFVQAGEKYAAALAINPDKHETAYNVACLKTFMGDVAGCREWLEKAYEVGGAVALDGMEEDPDFASVRDEGWFKELLEKAQQNKPNAPT